MPPDPDRASADDSPDAPTIPLQRGSPVNIFLIVGSLLLFFRTNFGEDDARLIPWVISRFDAYGANSLFEVRHGEVWRLATPAFLHFGVTHLGFNLLNLMMLGNILERRLRSWHYLMIVAGIVLASNLGQYYISGHGGFGGMSGVVYGLIGYVWLRGRRDPTFGLMIPNQTLVIALVWFVVVFHRVPGSNRQRGAHGRPGDRGALGLHGCQRGIAETARASFLRGGWRPPAP